MQRRVFMSAGLAASAVALSGCAGLGRNSSGLAGAASEGFIVRPKPVPSDAMTEFLPEGETVYMSGTINPDTATGFVAVQQANPKARRLVMLQADGRAGSPEAMAFGRALRTAGFSTHLRNDSVITGGAVDAFLGGTQRTLEDGAVVASARTGSDEAYQAYVRDMTGGDGYARFSEKFGGKRRPRRMTIAEIGAMGVVSGASAEVMSEEG